MVHSLGLYSANEKQNKRNREKEKKSLRLKEFACAGLYFEGLRIEG
jgi:hypothetical protein